MCIRLFVRYFVFNFLFNCRGSRTFSISLLFILIITYVRTRTDIGDICDIHSISARYAVKCVDSSVRYELVQSKPAEASAHAHTEAHSTSG